MRMNLLENLAFLASDWLTAHHVAGNVRVSLATIGARVHKDAKLFERIAEGGSISVARFEMVVDYLSDPENWPGRSIPIDTALRLARMGIVQPGERLVVEREVLEREVVTQAA